MKFNRKALVYWVLLLKKEGIIKKMILFKI